MSAIPIIFITGFLGAGKTTFLNRLLSLPGFREPDVALLINEFGSRNLDRRLIRPGPWPCHELNHGSLFCVCLKTDFIKTLKKIQAAAPRLVLVEATGLASPCAWEELVDVPSVRDAFRVQSIICLVDGLNCTKVLGTMKACADQIRGADALVINKTDLISSRELGSLQRLLKEMNPDAPQAAVSHGAVPPDFLEDLRHRPRRTKPACCPPVEINALTIRRTGTLDRAAFAAGLQSLGDHLLRLKGTADFGAGPVFVEAVLGPELMEKPAPPDSPAGASLVVIVKNRTPAQTRSSLGF